MEEMPKRDLSPFYCVVKCASQNAGEALLLMQDLEEIHMNLNFEYSPDEWSLEQHVIIWKTKITFIDVIHSDGA